MAHNNRRRIKSIWYFGKKYMPMFLIAEFCILISYAIAVLLPINLTMIARILLRQPDFIIMDEATSALDIETEKAISKYINSISNNITLLIISHRLETIRNCDKILVLNDHKIEASGTHTELLNSLPTYAAMFGR